MVNVMVTGHGSRRKRAIANTNKISFVIETPLGEEVFESIESIFRFAYGNFEIGEGNDWIRSRKRANGTPPGLD
jgi:hypothetical protein